MSELRFDDKVVIVTGAGNGLGRAHALLFGSRGAKVVVNDLGGDAHGGGKSSRAADLVVDAIKEAGGEAVANYDSVVDGEKIVQTALDVFGRVDIVVNNAGILRDISFHKMTQDDWDVVYQVHVLGSMKVTHAAWPHMREQKYGRIIMTASAAGIYGNFGQANYAMAKLGLAGFSNTLAIEGRKRNIHCNTIAPLAGSRLTETVLPKDVTEALAPEVVSPLVAVLCHEDCEETGGLYEVGGGFFGKLRWQRASGKMFRVGKTITPETLRSNWDAIAGFSDVTHPSNIAESMGPIMENVNAGPSQGGNEFIDVDEALGYRYPSATSSYDERDLALYALGVGAARDALDDKDLSLVYEMHGEFAALPTYGVIPGVNQVLTFAKEGIVAPGLNYGLDKVLHGEQFTKLERPLPRNATLRHETTIKEIFDKGKGALIVTEIKSYDEDGDLLITNEVTTFVRGAGGWGGDRGPSEPTNVPPAREPDAVIEETVAENQALLYRLSGDWNPLHADPAFARAMRFERPILHGLCTFGFAGRHVIKSFAPGGDPRFFKSVKVRFAKSVFPGDTLVTKMWKESDQKIVFEVSVKERDEVVISHAAIELYESIPKKVAKKKAAKKAAPASGPTSRDIFGGIDLWLKEHPETLQKIGKVFAFKLSAPESAFTIDVRGETGVTEGETIKPDCTLLLSDANFMAMCTGQADPMKLYMSGDLKIEGDVMASQRLTFLQKVEERHVAAAMEARGDAPVSSAAPPSDDEGGVADVFLGIKAYVDDNPDLLTKVAKVFQFRLQDPDSTWTIDVKNGEVGAGELTAPDCTLMLSDENFAKMTRGEVDPMKLYMGGDLKIEGDVMASQKLSFLQKIDPAWATKKIAELKASGVTLSGGGSSVSPSATATACAPGFFAGLVIEKGEPARVQFRISDPESAYLLDLGTGEVKPGEYSDVDAIVTVDDASFAALVSHEASAKSLFQRGKLRVDGNLHAVRRLTFV